MRGLFLLLVALPLAARAEIEDDPPPAPSVVRPQLDGVIARFTARYVVTATPGSTTHTLALPGDAVITGATVTLDGVAHPLALQRAAEASDHFEAVLAGTPMTAGRAAALVTWSRDAAEVELLLPTTHRTIVDLELTAPTCFVADARFVQVPRPWLRAVDPALRRTAPDQLELHCGSADEDHAWIGFPSRELAAQPTGDGRIGATAGRLALDGAHVAHVELDLAGKLSDVPRDLATAIVIDGSRSLSQDELDAQRLLVESYVRNAGTTRVQVIAYARTAHALLPSWTMAQVALPRLDRELRALATRNGSNVDAGLAEAGAWLARIDGTRRVVLISDERTPNRVDQEDELALRKALPVGTLVHVVALDRSDTLTRDGNAKFASLAVATAGIAVRGGGGDATPDAAVLLVRPVTLDAVEVRAPGWTATEGVDACQLDEDGGLGEGASCRWWFVGNGLAGPIVVAGKLWGHPVTRVLRPDPTRGMALARELVGMQASLEEALMAKVADAAHAVSERWSMFAAWGGTGGYGESEIGLGRYGTGSCCDRGTGSSAIGSRPRMQRQLDVSMQLRDVLRACHAERSRVEFTLETTLAEIVDVKITMIPGMRDADTAATRAATTRCIEEAIWDLALAIQDPPFHTTTELAIGPL
ncbi:MAG: VWA domain-containing protein [Proteobacteria bacterium]|nr:VWA domain-containing protein [Pseudomonadota bacterium]